MSKFEENLASRGWLPAQIQHVGGLLRPAPGMVIVAGPVGSLIHSTLQHLIQGRMELYPDNAIAVSLEDPPEFLVQGARATPVIVDENQSDTSDKSVPLAYGFVRDRASAKLAVDAAKLGTQVFATLHTDDCFNAIKQLAAHGLTADQLQDPKFIRVIVSPRIVKVLCPFCKMQCKADDLPAALNDRLSNTIEGDLSNVFVKGQGCHKCRDTGIASRMLIHEVVAQDSQLLRLIADGKLVEAVSYWKTELGGVSLMDIAIDYVTRGLMDPVHVQEKLGKLESSTYFSIAPPASTA